MEKQTIENHFRGNYQPFYGRYLPKLQEASGDEAKAICPFHKDRDPSLSVNNQTGLFTCFGCGAAGSIFDFYAKTHDMALPGDFSKVLAGIAEDFTIGNIKQIVKPTVTARYDYKDEAGNLVYQIERLEPKSFRIRRPDGQGWLYNAKGVKIIPYHLPEILKAIEIIVCEGEKDADKVAALGFTATTNPFGAGKWPDHFGPYFAGKHVVLIPDNDDQGRAHMKQVAAILKGPAASIRWLELPGLLEKGDVSDFIATFSNMEEAAERLAVMIEGAAEYREETTETPAGGFTIINAADWLQTEPPPPDQILADTFDAGDKVAIIGSSKLRKSFFLLQMDISLAAGRDFLTWRITKPRKVLHCQFEITDHHFHRRLKKMARAMGIIADDLGDRLKIINARGLGISGPEGVERIQKAAMVFHPEIICFDPLYKLTTGIENDAQDMKIILDAFDKLAEQTGAAPIYIHHDAKGSPGDRDIRDRGAGSNVLGRDYDVCITLTAHSQDPDAAVVEILLRNYRPQEPFTITWTEDENGGYRFEERPDILPEKKTSKTKSQPPPLATYLQTAASILGDEEMEIAPFKTSFKTQTGLSDHRIRDFLTWATAGGNPYITTRESRGKGTHQKWLKLERRFSDEQ